MLRREKRRWWTNNGIWVAGVLGLVARVGTSVSLVWEEVYDQSDIIPTPYY